MASILTSEAQTANNFGENMDSKKAEVTEKLQKREDDRLAVVQKRKEVKDSQSAENESPDFFQTNFAKYKLEITTGLEDAASLGKGQLQDHFAQLLEKLSTLQKFTTDTAMFLPAYDLQQAQATVMSMHKDILEKRDILIPKKKFAFKSKKKIGADAAANGVKTKPEAIIKKEIQMQITECNFADVTSQTLVKKAEETNDQDVALARLTDCVVKLHGSPRAIHMDGLTNCKVLTGPVSGSIIMDNCVDCTFVLACQQLRTHHTTNSHFYIHVTSKAIIEDCTGVKFAPYNWDPEGLEDSYKLSGLDKARNNWDDVDDFNWLANDAHSPNWSVLDESERVKAWDL